MSGIFWDESSQPDLVESLGSFGSSSLTLAMALPMCLLDIICAIVLYIASVLGILIIPVMEFLRQIGQMTLSTSGLEEFWSSDYTLVLGLAIYIVTAVIISRRAGTNYQQIFTKFTSVATSILWITNFLVFPIFDKAQFSQVGLLSLALQLGQLCIQGLLLEHTNYRHNATTKTSLDKLVTSFAEMLNLEIMGTMIICAFGYPTLSLEEDVNHYYCAVPFVAMQLVYFTSILKLESVDGVSVNGHATEVHDTLAEAAAATVETVKGKVAEVKEKIESKVDSAISENPKVLEAAANAEAVGQIVEEKVEKLVDGIKEKAADTVDEVKSDPLFQRIVAMIVAAYNCMASYVAIVLKPLINAVSCITAKLATVPWASITLLLTTIGSHILYAAAWYHLTESSLAIAFPVFNLLLPCALDHFGNHLNAALLPYIQESRQIAVAVLTYSIIKSGSESY